MRALRLATVTRTWSRRRLRPSMLPTVVPRLVTLCLAARSACWRWRRCCEDTGRRQRPGRSASAIAIAGAGGRGSSVLRGAPSRASALSRVALGSVSRADDSEGARCPGTEPSLHGAAVGKPRAARIPRADRDDARSRDAHRSRCLPRLAEPRRADILSAGAAAISSIWPVSAAARCSTRSPEAVSHAGDHRAASAVVVLAGELLERRDARVRAIASARWRDCSTSSLAAGVEQVIRRVSRRRSLRAASPEKPAGSLRSRLAEHLAAAETAACAMQSLAQETVQGTVPDPACAQSRSARSTSRAPTTSAPIAFRAWGADGSGDTKTPTGSLSSRWWGEGT